MPVDRCNVFFYPRKERTPLLAGELRLLPGMKGSVFQYSKDFIANPNAIPLDPFSLPLQPAEMVTVRDGDSLIPDAFSDAGPDVWGRAVIDRVARLERSSEFDYLLATGSNRAGALDFSIDLEEHEAVSAQIDDLADIEIAIDQVRRKLPIEERLRHLLALGTSVGGMRPKTIVEKEGHLWIAKFNARDEDFDAVSMEYAGMLLANQCGIAVPDVHKHQFQDQRIALLVRRFDRESLDDGQYGRIPYISARTLLRGYGREIDGTVPSEYSYILLAQVRRLTGQEETLGADLKEIFRRMVFNILIDNTDDHERNHGFLYERGWRLAPAFDISSQLTALGYQAMKVGADNTHSTLVNALSECAHFGLKPEEALELVNQLIDATGSLQAIYRDAGVDSERVENAARIRDNIISAFRARPKVDQSAQMKKQRIGVRKNPPRA
jgi:serine/threonine-protein kinase HipA